MEPNTNFDKWQQYTSGLSSPQNYIDWSWIYLINASLQRRVWIGPSHQPCYPNIYVILVGQPGIGKGLVIREVSDILKYWKLKDITAANVNVEQSQKETANAILETDLKNAQDAEFQGKAKGGDIVEPGLIPVAADATTYEALVEAVASSLRRINYPKWCEKSQKNILGIYSHSSLCFSLQELSSLMRKRTEDTVNFMLGLYDCPVDYEYVTKTKGKDRIRKGCLNILAGTTPSFMQSTFDDKLTGEGFTSRTFYIFNNKNRKNQMFIPLLTEDQKASKLLILEHVRKLTQLYGEIIISDETREFLQKWWDDQEKNKHQRSNQSLQLIPYYSRKNIHIMKVAIGKHFGESTEMTIPIETFKWAIEFVAKEEKNMHFAITLESNNPQAKVARRILEFLNSGKKGFIDLSIETYGMIDSKGLEAALTFLQDTGQVAIRQENEDDKTVNYWMLKGEDK